jgi:hypothetical protein
MIEFAASAVRLLQLRLLEGGDDLDEMRDTAARERLAAISRLTTS